MGLLKVARDGGPSMEPQPEAPPDSVVTVGGVVVVVVVIVVGGGAAAMGAITRMRQLRVSATKRVVTSGVEARP